MMQISPVYDGAPILAIDGLGDPSAALRRQRARLLDTLRPLDASQWDAHSRCEKWSVKDVAAHLVDTDRFWAVSFSAGVHGSPTRLLAGFDPAATPEEMVGPTRAASPADVLARYTSSVDAMATALDAVTDWSVLAEAPPGHLALNVTALHALWDGWVHERDIVIPLGIAPVEDEEEVALILQYAAALSPSFYASRGTGERGALVVDAKDPQMLFTVDVADRVVVRPGNGDGGVWLRGTAVELIEGFSHRAPLPALAPGDQWLLAGLSEVFDVA